MSTNNLKSDAECPPTLGGERRFFCPSKNENNEWMCVTLGQLCNTKPDCPEGEDENDTMCLFHRPVSIHTPTLEYTSNQLHECYATAQKRCILHYLFSQLSDRFFFSFSKEN